VQIGGGRKARFYGISRDLQNA